VRGGVSLGVQLSFGADLPGAGELG